MGFVSFISNPTHIFLLHSDMTDSYSDRPVIRKRFCDVDTDSEDLNDLLRYCNGEVSTMDSLNIDFPVIPDSFDNVTAASTTSTKKKSGTNNPQCMAKCKRLQEYLRGQGCGGILRCHKRQTNDKSIDT